ncbi:MAG TPA: 16S rRNA (cytosine(1402)-N(4))-methyltransferase RsmH [Gammaproteobacteria bacterium]|nr:16S rRNA (cytosine(1402)-N(4))-methyltransferase RsmH [Gammaproteobacteria bacterium]
MGIAQTHRPVLLEEALAGLAINADGRYVDGTFGRGGHARAILAQLGPAGRLLALDKDPAAVREAEAAFAAEPRLTIKRGSFAMLAQHVKALDWLGRVDGILLDLGVSSPQLDDPARGFSFRRDGPLDMRMDPDSGVSAAQWLAGAGEAEIARVLRDFGEERYARRIARAIVAARTERPIDTTGRLAAIVAAANPSREPGKDPATRSFQGIRIFINHELDDLHACLDQVLDVLAPGGRLVVISFHSLEDRMVKRFMRDASRGDDFPPDLPVTAAQLRPRLRLVGKAVRPGEAELRDNPRARSSVLRVAERLA